MRLALAMRTIALLIAGAGVVDPEVTLPRHARQPLTITTLETPSLDLPDGNTTRRQRAARAAEALKADLRDSFDVSLHHQSPQTDADPCFSDGPCVVISDGARPRTLSARSSVLGAVRVGRTLTPNVAIRRVGSPLRADPTAAAILSVDLEGHGVAGTTTALEVTDNGVVVGQASHTWPATANDTGAFATIQVPWTPVRAGVRDVRVEAAPTRSEVTRLDNVGHAAVEIAPRSSSVFVYEPQPTWQGTFVRRALESDSRFRVFAQLDLGLSRRGPEPGQGVANLALDVESIRRTLSSVILVTAPHLLDDTAIAVLEQFARMRGGTVVLMLDRRPEGRLLRLLPRVREERFESAPARVGDLLASEIVTFDASDLTTTVLASANGDAVVVSRALGRGRVVASGALDAWRFRDDARFARFWRSTVADAADAAGDAVRLTLTANVVRPNDPVELDVEVRALEPLGAVEVEVSATCAPGSPDSRPQQGWQVRLWPSGGPGRFRGTFLAPDRASVCRIEVGPSIVATAAIVVRDVGSETVSEVDALSSAVAAYGGSVVSSEGLGALVTTLRASASPQRVSARAHALRSPWWIVPFAACLTGEWWLRRRRRLR